MRCADTNEHGPHPHTYKMTSRWCEGVRKEPFFCGDRKGHKRHENATHYCPGITRRQIQEEAASLRHRLRTHGVMVPLSTLVRDHREWTNALTVLDDKQTLLINAHALITEVTEQNEEYHRKFMTTPEQRLAQSDTPEPGALA